MNLNKIIFVMAILIILLSITLIVIDITHPLKVTLIEIPQQIFISPS